MCHPHHPSPVQVGPSEPPASQMTPLSFYCQKRWIYREKEEETRNQQIPKNKQESILPAPTRAIIEVGFHYPVIQGLRVAVIILEGIVAAVQQRVLQLQNLQAT